MIRRGVGSASSPSSLPPSSSPLLSSSDSAASASGRASVVAPRHPPASFSPEGVPPPSSTSLTEARVSAIVGGAYSASSTPRSASLTCRDDDPLHKSLTPLTESLVSTAVGGTYSASFSPRYSSLTARDKDTPPKERKAFDPPPSSSSSPASSSSPSSLPSLWPPTFTSNGSVRSFPSASLLLSIGSKPKAMACTASRALRLSSSIVASPSDDSVPSADIFESESDNAGQYDAMRPEQPITRNVAPTARSDANLYGL
mmetsp:Transcript_22259/g.45060  ORF Transcript_22259/g.45060 Transcript_22259/m.45060 type:complete len:257 (-) Transcript_22259:187-957(-)